jgi:tetratricopeptide (TPR) repeat protein
VSERPDALNAAGHGLVWTVCPDCDATAPIDAPLLIMCPRHWLPLILAVSADELAGNSPSSRLLIDREAQQVLGYSPTRAAGPMVPVARSILPIVLPRDVLHDLSDIDAACRSLAGHGPETERQYRAFLNAVRESEPKRRLAQVFLGLPITEPEDLEEYVQLNPVLLTKEAVDYAAMEAAEETPGPPDGLFRLRQQFIEQLRSAVPIPSAVRDYRLRLEALKSTVHSGLNLELGRLTNAAMSASGPEKISSAREVLELAVVLGEARIEAELSGTLAARLMADARLGVARYEEAIYLLSRSLELLTEGDLRWAFAASHLAVAYARRAMGDDRQNWETALDLMARASRVERGTDPKIRALLQSNFGLLLVENPYREPDDINRGIEHVRASFEERSPERDRVGWAYSMVNLGLSYQKRAETGDVEAASACYREVLRHLTPEDDLGLWSTAHANLAEILLSGDPPDLDEAEIVARTALARLEGAGDLIAEAKLTWACARAAEHRTGIAAVETVELLIRALRLTDPQLSPDLHLRIGNRLTAAYAALDDRLAEADVFTNMLTALDTLYAAQTTPEGRREILDRYTNLARWATFALARAGRLEQAVEAIERGLARELGVTVGRDTADLGRLTNVDRTLAEQYQSAQRELGAALAATGADAVQRVRSAENAVRAAIDQIRQIPGFSGFLKEITAADIAQIAGQHAILYLVSAPRGSYVLSIQQGPTGASAISATHVSMVTSVTVVRAVTGDPEDLSRDGLLAAQVARILDREMKLEAAIGRLVALQPLLEPVVQQLNQAQDHTCVLIPTGLTGIVPLHAVPIDSTGQSVLDDAGQTILAPSAAVYAATRTRLHRSDHPHLVAVADPGPDGDLPCSRSEVTAISESFGPNAEKSIRVGDEATRSWLLENLEIATHLHFACHGKSGWSGGKAPTLTLAANTHLTVDDLQPGRLPRCRLVVASACQSGHYGSRPLEWCKATG